MTLPYKARLVLLINSEWVELVRFKRSMMNTDLNFFTRGLTSPWRVERPLTDKRCLSSRPTLEILQ